MKTCEIKWCGRNTSKLIYVNENIGDGAWRVGICRECAEKLGLKNGGDLPLAHIVREKIK